MSDKIYLFKRTCTIRSPYGMSRPTSVCRLSVTLPCRRLNISAVFLAPSKSLGIGHFSKVLKKNSVGFYVIVQVKLKGLWKIDVFRFISKMPDTRYSHSYNGRWIGNRMRSIEWIQFQWSWTTLSDLQNF